MPAQTSQPTSPSAVHDHFASVQSQHGLLWALFMHRVINPLMRLGLSSRFHPQAGSDTLMVLSFRGRRSGKTFQFPIGYMQDGSMLICYSPFGWWKNLAGGVPVTVVLRGQPLSGSAEVCTDTATIQTGMDRYLRHNPGDAKYFSVKTDANGNPSPADIAHAAERNVQIRIHLEATPFSSATAPTC